MVEPDEAVCVWDVNDPTNTTSPQLVLRGHTGRVHALAAIDGGRLASGGQDKVIRIWNVNGGILEGATPVAKLEGHSEIVLNVAVFPDGRRVVSGGRYGELKVWDVETGECVATLKGHSEDVWGVAWFPDGRRVVSGSDDYTLKVWDVETGECVATLKGHVGAVNGVAVLPDERVVSASDDMLLKVWDVATGECVAMLEGHSDQVYGVAVFPDGRRVVSASRDNTLKVWDVATGECVATLKGHSGWVRGVAVFPDGRRVVSGSWDNTLKVWDVATGECLATLKGHTGRVNCLAVLDDGRLASGGAYETKEFVSGAINDSCKTGVDRFGSRPLAGAIVEVVGGASPPVCVGLYAKWGRGKSFLIHQIKQHFDTIARVDPRGGGQVVQHFEPGYDKLERAVTDKTPDTVEKTSPSTCTKVLNIIGNALFYLLTLTLWWFYKRETVITIIDTVAETIRDLGAIGKDLRKRTGTILGCCSCTTHEKVPTDDIESKAPPKVPKRKREYIFVDFNACTDSVSSKFFGREYAQSDELWTGLVKKMYAAVELRLSKQVDFTRKKEPSRDDREARVVTSLARDDWKTAWRVKRAKEVLGAADEWSEWGLRLRALLMVFMPPVLVALTSFLVLSGILDFAGVSGFGLFDAITNSFTSVKKFFDLVAVSAAPIVAGIATYKAGIKTDEVAAKSRGEVFFEEAKQAESVKDRLGFLARVKDEVSELFSFLHTLKDEAGYELIIVPFVDDLDRVIGGNGDRVTKVLEAVSLILSIENAPVVTFLAIDPRIVISSIEDGFGAVIRDAKVTGWEYLDKIVQFPIAIPQPAAVKVERFVEFAVDPSDAKVGTVAARLRDLIQTTEKIKGDYQSEDNPLDVYSAVFTTEDGEEYKTPLVTLATILSDERISAGANDVDLVRGVARRLEITRDVESLIESIGEEGLEMTCRALNRAFRSMKFEKRAVMNEEKQTPVAPALLTIRDKPPVDSMHHSARNLSDALKAVMAPSFEESALLVSAAEQVTLRAFAKNTDGNPRRLKRVINVFQLAVAYAKRLAVDEADQKETVYLNRRWPLFALKLIKFIVLCEEQCINQIVMERLHAIDATPARWGGGEEHPIRMSLLVSQVEDAHQKAEVNSVCTSDMFQYLADDYETAAKHLEPSMLLATFYYKHVDSLYYLQRDCLRNLMQDGDPENFAMLLSMKLPSNAIKGLPPSASTSDYEIVSDMDATAFDLVVGDLIRKGDRLSLLDYALNLSPALRDTITRDVAQTISEYEPRLRAESKSDASAQGESFQLKAPQLRKPPKFPTAHSFYSSVRTGGL